MSTKYKSKKRVYDSSEDEPQSSKKSKVITTEAKKDKEGNTYWELSGTRRVQISDFKGKKMVGIREYYEKDGQFLPGKKGISLPLDQFTALIGVLPQVISHLSEFGEEIPLPNFGAKKSGRAIRDDDHDSEHSATRSRSPSNEDRFTHKHKRNHESTSEEDD
ncbi:ssDNA-binding transcriptional regulator [Myriangium duriaei CBS 260.36]|uniref:SsDNA-binding transcriptional regulator n=1 Tax=Myriangium duriaei CBS 260.36 TaxID=1168546 RepID=A0A9P4IX01_9PEZI|nr:ssDNA-binding transcriptional regulator [Myriangium duriaei CBS 260.36]